MGIVFFQGHLHKQSSSPQFLQFQNAYFHWNKIKFGVLMLSTRKILFVILCKTFKLLLKIYSAFYLFVSGFRIMHHLQDFPDIPKGLNNTHKCHSKCLGRCRKECIQPRCLSLACNQCRWGLWHRCLCHQWQTARCLIHQQQEYRY